MRYAMRRPGDSEMLARPRVTPKLRSANIRVGEKPAEACVGERVLHAASEPPNSAATQTSDASTPTRGGCRRRPGPFRGAGATRSQAS
jgi:hypothetical protein